MLTESVDAGYRLVVTTGPVLRPDGLRHVWDILRSRGTEGLVVVSVDAETGKPIFLAAGTDGAVAAGFNAGGAVREIAGIVGGRGGGKPNMAQGGGEDASRIDEALTAARRVLGVG